MTALPRKHPTGGQKLKRSNFVYPRYDRDEAGLRKKKIGQQGKPSSGQPLQAQPQRGWTAQPAQPSQQNPQQPEQQQLPPVGNLWRAIILIIMAILAMIVLLHIISNLAPTSPSGDDGDGSECTCYCDTGEVCTTNSQCPSDTSVPGTSVPGVCGCPVGC